MAVSSTKAAPAYLSVAGLLLFCVCQSFQTATPPRLKSPHISAINLTEAKLYGSWRPAIRIAWTPPNADTTAIRSFTLIRKAPGDSIYDVFTRSQEIPDSISVFNDDVTPIGFPYDGFTLVSYKISAIDSLGRPGDTSAPCSLYCAPQPNLDTIDRSNWCFRWHSSRIQGSVSSAIKIWNDAVTVSWQSAATEDFGSHDFPTYFTACLPDSLKPLPAGTWYFALYLEAMGVERQSLNVGSFNVP
jgi:hypothetical protein